MVPVAVLPAAAILLGVGYAIDPVGWGSQSQLAGFFIKAGSAIIDNMAVLFAVGIAYGMSKDKDGAAALAGFVGFIVVTTLLSPESITLIQGIAIENVPTAFGKIDNQFIGILSGVIAAMLYNKFGEIELHKTLAFFSGRRFVPIITSFVMIFVAFILMYIWPLIYNALVSFGGYISSLEAVGAGLYGFFNRLLIPIGLHHALNSVFWFDVAGINDIPNFLSGQGIKGVTGIYQAGFFPIMMFGLPGAALAIYKTSFLKNKEKTASIMIAASFAAFFTGVTEPLEFAFMFVAPVLYVLHAALTGISLFIAAKMQWIAGFGFSAGLVDLVLSSRNPLAQNWVMLIFQGLVFFAIYYLAFYFVITKFNLSTPGREKLAQTKKEYGLVDKLKTAKKTQAKKNVDQALDVKNTDSLGLKYIKLLGGFSNIENIDSCISRLRLILKDTSIVKKYEIKALGAIEVLELGENNLQIIIGPKVESLAKEMQEIFKRGQ